MTFIADATRAKKAPAAAAGMPFRNTAGQTGTAAAATGNQEQWQVSDTDSQFDLRRRHPFARFHLLANAVQSQVARCRLRCSLDVSYGSTAGQKLDIFPAQTSKAPVFLFIHGGYFRALDKSQYRYVASRMVRQGYTVVLVNYDLAPTVRVAEIIRQVLASFHWVRENIPEWNGDPERIMLCGHSVGAFLAARILEEERPGSSGIRKAALLSGLFDLEPMKRSFLNRDLHLSDADAANLNPRAEAITERPDILVAVGSRETGQFISQSKDYSRRLANAGIRNRLMVLPRINHYSMSRLLASRRNPVMDWISGSSHS
ncbi:alpha/beta hydrolase [Leisingera sp. ANG-Vp]|uniref:alpha/beta hydrolase n=1 Tax=Leisingera sp. ANG-Vp TaxID=1577896 RepID=UPI000691E82A|nr:alpha/beta hydrolase [Leisingera sp. ANG-Vp]